MIDSENAAIAMHLFIYKFSEMFSVQRKATSIIMWASGKEQNVSCMVNCSFKSSIMGGEGLYILDGLLMFDVALRFFLI